MRYKRGGLLSNAGTFSITYNLPYWWLKVSRKYTNMGDLDILQQKRLLFLKDYYQFKNVLFVCQRYNISRKTFYKWRKRFEESKRKLSSLANLPKTPKTKRRRVLDFKIELNIKHLREKYIRLGKVKLQRLFKRKYGHYVSQSHIAYVIQKYNLFYDPFKAKRIRSKKNNLIFY